MISCSRLQPRPCSRLQVIPSTWAPTSASHLFCTPSALTHHPHVHMIVPGGGIALDGSRWVSCRSRFFLPWRVLAKLFRRLMLEKLVAAHAAGQLQFFGQHSHLAERAAFTAFMAPLRKIRWYVYGKRPFAGSEAVLTYLSRYTHRVAIANSRLIAFNKNTVSFKYKDYRIEGPDRYKVMTLATDEFIRRLLIHVLPKGFHRIRHYGLFANPQQQRKSQSHARGYVNIAEGDCATYQEWLY